MRESEWRRKNVSFWSRMYEVVLSNVPRYAECCEANGSRGHLRGGRKAEFRDASAPDEPVGLLGTAFGHCGRRRLPVEHLRRGGGWCWLLARRCGCGGGGGSQREEKQEEDANDAERLGGAQRWLLLLRHRSLTNTGEGAVAIRWRWREARLRFQFFGAYM